MCKNAVDRAALFLSIQNTELYKAFVVYAVPGIEWDDVDMENEFGKKFIETLEGVAKDI